MIFKCVPVGDKAISVQFQQEISFEVNRHVTDLAHRLAKMNIAGVLEFVPTYASLMIYYNPLQITYKNLVEILSSMEEVEQAIHEKRRTFLLPALYGGVHGPDLEEVADYHQLSVEEVVSLHSSVHYQIYLLGFSPGFPYLGGLSEKIATPRLKTPRALVPAGSIGIAGSQTGIYSLDSPGGWRIIAHTPVPLFRPADVDEPFLLRAGDFIKFIPVLPEEYEAICQEVRKQAYTPQIVEM